MGKFVVIDDILLTKVVTMYDQGYSYHQISLETDLSVNVIRNRLGKTRDDLTLNRPRGGRPKGTQPPPLITYSPHRYDYLLDEPTNQGKMYADYFKK